jgi:hypothetical protein
LWSAVFETITDDFRSAPKPFGNLWHHSLGTGPDAAQQTFRTRSLPRSGDHQANSDTNAKTGRERCHHGLTFVPLGELSHPRCAFGQISFLGFLFAPARRYRLKLPRRRSAEAAGDP